MANLEPGAATNTANDTTAQIIPAPSPSAARNQCRHLYTDGRRCGSPALRNEHFCFYHHASHRPLPVPRYARYPNQDTEAFHLPVLEDRRAIQLAISQVLSRIAANDLDPKRAGFLLYGLQVAVSALPPEPRHAAPPAPSLRIPPSPRTRHPHSTTRTTPTRSNSTSPSARSPPPPLSSRI